MNILWVSPNTKALLIYTYKHLKGSINLKSKTSNNIIFYWGLVKRQQQFGYTNKSSNEVILKKHQIIIIIIKTKKGQVNIFVSNTNDQNKSVVILW